MYKFKRIPRKLKKELKNKFKHRYGCTWINCCNIMEEYYWFYFNPFKWDMHKKL